LLEKFDLCNIEFYCRKLTGITGAMGKFFRKVCGSNRWEFCRWQMAMAANCHADFYLKCETNYKIIKLFSIALNYFNKSL
jgi:hypothetical protein